MLKILDDNSNQINLNHVLGLEAPKRLYLQLGFSNSYTTLQCSVITFKHSVRIKIKMFDKWHTTELIRNENLTVITQDHIKEALKEIKRKYTFSLDILSQVQ